MIGLNKNIAISNKIHNLTLMDNFMHKINLNKNPYKK